MKESEEGFSYHWDADAIFNDIINLLSTKILNTSPSETFRYIDAFSPEKKSDIIDSLTSDTSEDLEKAINLFFVLGENFKGSSPIEFINLISEASSKYYQEIFPGILPSNELAINAFAFLNWDSSQLQSPAKFFIEQLTEKCNNNSALLHLKEKVEKINTRWNLYLSNSTEKSENYQNCLDLLRGNLYTSSDKVKAKSFFDLIKGNASLATFKLVFKDIMFAKELGLTTVDLFFYHPEKIALLDYFKHLLQYETEKFSLGFVSKIIEKAITLEDNEVINYLLDSTNFPSEFFQGRVVSEKILAYACKTKNFHLIVNLIERGVKPKKIISKTSHKLSLLNYAIKENDSTVLRAVISK